MGLIKWLRHNKLSAIMSGFVLIICIALPYLFNFDLNWPVIRLGGDEPHYLVMADSLVRHHSLDIKQEYQKSEYRSFFPGGLDYHLPPGLFTPESSHWYSFHSPGLAILVAPFFALARVKGALFAMSVLSFVLLIEIYVWSTMVTLDKRAALFAAAVYGSTLSFLTLAGRIFPDIPQAVLTMGALILLVRKRSSVSNLLLGSLIGVSIWIHMKMGLILFTAGTIALYQEWFKLGRRHVRIVSLVLPWFVLWLGYEIAIHSWYNVILPSSIYANAGQLWQLSPTQSIPAMLFDSAKGLFINNPILLLLLVGLPVWAKRQTTSLALAAMIVLPTVLLQSTFSDWSGGWAPIGRYITAWLPVFLPALAFVFQEARHKILALTITVLSIIELSMAFLYWRLAPSWPIPGQRSHFFASLQFHTGLNLDQHMVLFGDGTWAHTTHMLSILHPTHYAIVLLFYSMVVAALVGYGIKLSHGKASQLKAGVHRH